MHVSHRPLHRELCREQPDRPSDSHHRTSAHQHKLDGCSAGCRRSVDWIHHCILFHLESSIVRFWLESVLLPDCYGYISATSTIGIHFIIPAGCRPCFGQVKLDQTTIHIYYIIWLIWTPMYAQVEDRTSNPAITDTPPEDVFRKTIHNHMTSWQ